MWGEGGQKEGFVSVSLPNKKQKQTLDLLFVEVTGFCSDVIDSGPLVISLLVDSLMQANVSHCSCLVLGNLAEVCQDGSPSGLVDRTSVAQRLDLLWVSHLEFPSSELCRSF